MVIFRGFCENASLGYTGRNIALYLCLADFFSPAVSSSWIVQCAGVLDSAFPLRPTLDVFFSIMSIPISPGLKAFLFFLTAHSILSLLPHGTFYYRRWTKCYRLNVVF